MSVDHELREAAAYLSRVAEAGSLALFRLVSERGYVQAAKDVRSGRAPWEVLRATEARRVSADPEVDLDAAERNGITLIYPSHALWPHLALSALHAALARTMQPPRRPPAREDPASPPTAETDPASASDVVPPIALWVKGVLAEGNTLDDLAVRSAAIVGSRAATAYGSHVASEFGYALASRDVTVVSGGAFGIDAAAHRGALAAGGKTILVSAGGLDRPYPSAHDTLF
ncbi:MAG: processing protein, partial [Mycobacterium sp.]|nr:processing protein [Mycobacterium sp.]